MPLSPGTSIGPYEIVAPLGAGGMGEVYRARDSRLGREVAIKSLPVGFTSDPDRVVRLEREARLLASLNHPGIASLYGIERVDGTPFLAIELVPGESLAERLLRGALPVDEALDLVAQVAAALEAAHDAGIVHRDLKPGNIMVRPDGVAKVLDFGLARGPADAASAPSDLSQSPTIVSPATIPGMILGTAAYMSPEQARGRATDRRADIWAWGCVLYECLTGKRAFPGEDVSETLASILKSEPDWPALPKATPPGVGTLLERCLRKDPRERLRDAGDLRLLLSEARSPGSAPEPAKKTSATQSAWFQIGIAIVAAVLSVYASRLVDRDQPEAATLTLAAPAGVSFDRSPTSIAISPDGSQLVFVGIDTVGAPRLWMRSVSRDNGRPLNGTEDAGYPFFSPDGRKVGFFAGGRLKTIELGTGAVQSLADAPLPRGGAWARGRILYQPLSLGPLWSIPEEGGTAVVATTLDSAAGDLGHRFPQFLPNGRHFIFTVLAREGTWAAAGEIGKSKTKRLFPTAGSTGATWSGGWLIALRDAAVKAQRFHARTLELQGPAVDLPGLRFVSPDAAGSPVVAASSNGTLVQRFSGDLPQRLAMVDRAGRTIRDIPAPVGTFTRGAMSPDGHSAVFEYTVPSGEAIQLWRADLVRGTVQPMTFEDLNFAPVISPDGREIAFTRESAGKRQNLWVMRSDEPASQRLLAELPSVFNTPLGYGPDGGVLLRTQGTETRQDLMFVSRTDSVRVHTVLATRFNEPTGAISPDGRWLAYVSDESGSYECRVRPFPIGTGQVTVVSQGAWGDPTITSRIGTPKWRRDGRELVYAAADGRTLMSVSVTPGPVPHFGPPRPLFRLANAVADIAASPDLNQFVLSITREEEGRSTATILLNWPRLVAKK